ncbi:MAG: ketoacyl-ACP synthase III [Bacteroidales bacterium]|nr:ketoacyl-ACP synthase III [Bacteroidales bacterium]MCF8458727.1 ketoacyl-ACP synthase III [Bacteroidales bacterium]
MAIFSIPNVKITGMAGAVPKVEINNWDYEWISKEERELFIKQTGIEKRRVVDGIRSTTTSDLCIMAAEKLLTELDWDRSEVDCLVFVSQSRDYIVPQTSTIMQHKLGLPKTCMSFDISLGCSAYVYGLSTIASHISHGQFKKALLMVGDLSSLSTCYKDKSSYPLFGDAATVTCLEYDPEAPPMHFNLQSDGAGWEAIHIPDGGLRNYYDIATSFEIKEISEGIHRNKFHVNLDGIKIFNFSLIEVPKNIKNLLKHVEVEMEDIDYTILHQANKMINEVIRKKMKIEPEKLPYSIHKYGNTSCASIPLTMVSEMQEALKNKKLNLLLSGFGVGLSWGSVYLQTENVHVSDIIVEEGE